MLQKKKEKNQPQRHPFSFMVSLCPGINIEEKATCFSYLHHPVAMVIPTVTQRQYDSVAGDQPRNID